MLVPAFSLLWLMFVSQKNLKAAAQFYSHPGVFHFASISIVFLGGIHRTLSNVLPTTPQSKENKRSHYCNKPNEILSTLLSSVSLLLLSLALNSLWLPAAFIMFWDNTREKFNLEESATLEINHRGSDSIGRQTTATLNAHAWPHRLRTPSTATAPSAPHNPS